MGNDVVQEKFSSMKSLVMSQDLLLTPASNQINLKVLGAGTASLLFSMIEELPTQPVRSVQCVVVGVMYFKVLQQHINIVYV